MRHVTYANKANKLSNKFIARLKWLPLSKRYKIFKEMA